MSVSLHTGTPSIQSGASSAAFKMGRPFAVLDSPMAFVGPVGASMTTPARQTFARADRAGDFFAVCAGKLERAVPHAAFSDAVDHPGPCHGERAFQEVDAGDSDADKRLRLHETGSSQSETHQSLSPHIVGKP